MWNPLGRLIVASMDSITTSYQFLQPLAQALPSYIRDNIHLLELLHPYTWEPKYHWVSLDVCSLYMMLVFKQFYISYPILLTSTRDSWIHNSCYQILSGKQLFKIWGWKLSSENWHCNGGKFCPSYANLTMGLWETRCIWHHNPCSTPGRLWAIHRWNNHHLGWSHPHHTGFCLIIHP